MTDYQFATTPLREMLIYQHLFAGCIPAVGADVEDAAARVAANALHDQRLHLLVSVSGGHVYFLAFPSRFATGDEVFATSLAVALPTHCQHRGDGIYTFAEAEVALVKRSGELHIFAKGDSDLERLAAKYGLQVHTIGTEAQSWPMEPIYGRDRKAAERMAQRVMHICRLVLVGSLVLYAGLGLSDFAARLLAERKATNDAIAETVRRLQYVSPLTEQLAHLQIVFGTVVRAGGWINGYAWKSGQEAFEIFLPGWVSHDYVDALGSGVTADFNIADNLVVVRKGNLDVVGKAEANDRR